MQSLSYGHLNILDSSSYLRCLLIFLLKTISSSLLHLKGHLFIHLEMQSPQRIELQWGHSYGFKTIYKHTTHMNLFIPSVVNSPTTFSGSSLSYITYSYFSLFPYTGASINNSLFASNYLFLKVWSEFINLLIAF